MRELRRKFVLVGDGFCGKSTLISAFYNQKPIEQYEPTIFDTYSMVTDVHKRRVQLELWDTAGQEEFSRVRPLSYPDVDVVIICFSIDSRESFANVKEIWLPECRHFCGQRVPILLVATKIDLRMQQNIPKKIYYPKETQKPTYLPVSTRSTPQMPQSQIPSSGLSESHPFQDQTSHQNRSSSNVTPLYCCRHRRFCTCYHSRICNTQRLCSGSSGSLNHRDSSFSSGSEHSDCSYSNDSSIQSSSSTTPPPLLPSSSATISRLPPTQLPSNTANGLSSATPVSSFLNNSIRTEASNSAFQRHALRSSRRVLPLNSAARMQPKTVSNPELPMSVYNGMNQAVTDHSNAMSMNTIYQHNRSLYQTLRSPDLRQCGQTFDLGFARNLVSDTATIATAPAHTIWSGGSLYEEPDLISTQEALDLCTEIHAAGLVECSAKMCIGVENVFSQALKICVRPKKFLRTEMCTIS